MPSRRNSYKTQTHSSKVAHGAGELDVEVEAEALDDAAPRGLGQRRERRAQVGKAGADGADAQVLRD